MSIPETDLEKALKCLCSSMLLKESLGEKIGILHEFGVDETMDDETGQIVREPNGTETITIRINGGKIDRIG